jgi:hypothetical protein
LTQIKSSWFFCLELRAEKPGERAFGSVIGDMRGTKASGARAMQHRRKTIEPTDWRFTVEQIGRELGKIYRQPKRLPRRLRAVVTQLERKVPARRGRQWAKRNNTD